MKKAEGREIKSASAWSCETYTSEEMDHAQMMEHLKAKHGLEPKGLKCNKEMLLHIDGSDFFYSQYKVTVGEGVGQIVMTNSRCNPRHKKGAIDQAPAD